MKRQISDLLDALEEDQVQISGETPLSSTRIKELTMKRIKEKARPRLYRLPVRIAAAAAAVALLTAAAFATADFMGAGDLMRDLFAQWNQEPLTTTQVETLNSVGHVFDGSEEFSVTSNGATITPIAALADEDCYYLRLRVEAPEGVVLPDLDRKTQGCYGLTGTGATDGYRDLHVEVADFYYDQVGLSKPYVTPGMREAFRNMTWICYTLPDDDPTDNVKEFALILESTEYNDIPYNDGVPKRLTIDGLWIHSPWTEGMEPGADTEVFRGTFTFDIGNHFESSVATIDCGGAVWTDPDTGETNLLDTMKLSPLGLKFEYRSNLAQLKDGSLWITPTCPGDVRVVMKDGSELSAEHGYSCLVTKAHQDHSDPYFQITPDMLTQTPEWELGHYWRFETPLDLSQVHYVQFGENIYYIDAG